MPVRLAESAGFCFGVNNAVNQVYRLLDEGEKVCTLGPIIHNPQVVDKLASRGVTIVDDPSQVPADSVLVIRSHGVPQSTYRQVEQLGVRCCDATCPFVSKIHKIVDEHSANGAVVLIAGNPEHPEVLGIRGHCHGDEYCFHDEAELENLLTSHPEWDTMPCIMVAQTTFNKTIWKKCEKDLTRGYCRSYICTVNRHVNPQVLQLLTF